MKASYRKYVLNFKRPSGTSRGILSKKETWFIVLEERSKYGIGECGILRGLSVDDRPDYEEKLQWTCNNITLGLKTLLESLHEFPSIQFGLEQAFLSLRGATPFDLFPSDFTKEEDPITINGLIWMGEKDFMLQQVQEKLKQNFTCIKLKIGAIDFDTEMVLLAEIRKNFSKNDIELRVDANGAFHPQEAMEKLRALANYDLHSIEQPIAPKQWEFMAELSQSTPLPIALDEELIGVFGSTEKRRLLQTVKPQYIILKPSLVGGFKGSKEWIDIASSLGIGWWITSALESNIGLNAIAQWTYMLKNTMPQGLGTGSLFTNNFPSPLEVANGQLFYRKTVHWPSGIIEDLCT